MKYLAYAAAAVIALVAIGPSAAFAQPHVGNCPPGLAKKNPPCVPPGQVGKRYDIGDIYSGDGYWASDERARFDLPRLAPGESYYRFGDSFLRVEEDTRLVLGLIDILAGATN